MGEVLRARDTQLEREVAYKRIHARHASKPGVVERFILEARAGSKIQSDHVVEVISAGFDHAREVPWLVMELLEGESLHAALGRRGRLALEEVVHIFRQLCHAGDYQCPGKRFLPTFIQDSRGCNK